MTIIKGWAPAEQRVQRICSVCGHKWWVAQTETQRGRWRDIGQYDFLCTRCETSDDGPPIAAPSSLAEVVARLETEYLSAPEEEED